VRVRDCWRGFEQGYLRGWVSFGEGQRGGHWLVSM
jgi:hypothetical protein